MKLIFLGTASAFTASEDNFNSNILLSDPDSHTQLLIDCGSDIRHALPRQGYHYADIDNVYISHLHADHSGGLEWLAVNTHHDPHCKKPTLYANADIMHDLWDKSLSGALMTLHSTEAKLSDFFNVHPLKANDAFVWQNITFQTIQTVHIVHGRVLMPSYGLIFTVNGIRVFITGDTQFMPAQLNPFYEQADIIFQDCETATPLQRGACAIRAVSHIRPQPQSQNVVIPF